MPYIFCDITIAIFLPLGGALWLKVYIHVYLALFFSIGQFFALFSHTELDIGFFVKVHLTTSV